MTVAIIDYGSGNLRSCAKAFERAVDDSGLQLSVVVTSDPADLMAASHIVLPGVGAFADCRAGLAAVSGMEAALEKQVRGNKKPFLGICVGMQLMADIGREHQVTDGLGWVPGEVVAITPSDASLKIPHMGWNDLDIKTPPHPLLDGIEQGNHVYFVHSYAFNAAERSDVLATVDYGGPVVAVIGRGNVAGTQFHPEKSQAVGLRLISNFLHWQPQ
ncbi:MAG: imidazole glycerol phosphate synthase subunit HisH [Alphaproteobacteria bacterium]|jgi:imidazole glycerol-phosphate synthase subunit HisH|nr:imidazole glycerol phosphate synthase subunit HisH [Alphaproteobacteria bacterium]MBT7943663.1 imidazole glycerol phosphate synthase subunit HisH [Alphaproteobacteria bacterium]